MYLIEKLYKMKKGIWIILFFYVCFPLRAQNSKELIEILLDFCQQVTQKEPSEEKIYAIYKRQIETYQAGNKNPIVKY